MDFQDNQNIQNIQKGDNTLTNILLIALGAAIVYFLLKSNQSQQAQSTQLEPVSTYENAEEWRIQRGDNGFIENLRVGRHANVGNGNEIINSNSESYTNNYSTDNSIDRKQLNKYINELVNKNLSERLSERIDFTNLNTNRIIYNDSERRRRFGMS